VHERVAAFSRERRKPCVCHTHETSLAFEPGGGDAFHQVFCGKMKISLTGTVTRREKLPSVGLEGAKDQAGTGAWESARLARPHRLSMRSRLEGSAFIATILHHKPNISWGEAGCP